MGLYKKYSKLRRKLAQTSFGNAIIPIPPPRRISIELTSRCNLMCTMCTFHSKKLKRLPDRRAEGDMDFELFQKIVEEVSSFSPKPDIALNYVGESLLYPRFPDVLILLRKLDLARKCELSTNGNLLNQKIADMVCESFGGWINVSLDGFKESHERIRVGSKYDKVHDNLMYLIERKRSLGVSSPTIVVNMVRVDQSESEIQAFVEYWVPLVDKVTVSVQMTPDQRIVESNRYLDGVLLGERKLCTWPFSYIGILWDGRVVPCCFDGLGLGADIKANLNDKSLLSIWRGSEYKRLRKKMIKGEVSDIPLCRNCEVWAGLYIKKEEKIMDEYTFHQGGTTTKYKRSVT